MSWLPRIALAAVLGIAVGGAPAAQTPAAPTIPLSDKVAELASDLVSEHGSPGVIVGVSDFGKRQFFAYGKRSRQSDAPIDADTLFEIGSITKVFTCLALAQMVGDGDLRLEQPVRELLPDTVEMPRGESREIRLVDIATHHSGLPRMPNNFRPKDPLNPYADYTVEQMYAFLGDHDLRREPGARYEYSNLAMGLLGHALARQAGTDYGSLIEKRICQPLGLRDTVIELNAEQRGRLAKAHLRNGIATSNWDLPTLAGAGALRSTARDLLAFAEGCLEPPDEDFAAAVALTMEPRRQHGALWIGLAWHINGEGDDRWWGHNGATGGYTSFLSINPAKRLAVVVLSNRQRGGKGPTPAQLGTGVVRLVEAR